MGGNLIGKTTLVPYCDCIKQRKKEASLSESKKWSLFSEDWLDHPAILSFDEKKMLFEMFVIIYFSLLKLVPHKNLWAKKASDHGSNGGLGCLFVVTAGRTLSFLRTRLAPLSPQRRWVPGFTTYLWGKPPAKGRNPGGPDSKKRYRNPHAIVQ